MRSVAFRLSNTNSASFPFPSRLHSLKSRATGPHDRVLEVRLGLDQYFKLLICLEVMV
jgi:hypothetical protein